MGKLRTGGWSQVPKVGGAQVSGRQHSLGRGEPGRPAWWQRASSLLCLQNPQEDKTHGLTVMQQARVPRAGPQAALAPAHVSEKRHALSRFVSVHSTFARETETNTGPRRIPLGACVVGQTSIHFSFLQASTSRDFRPPAVSCT